MSPAGLDSVAGPSDRSTTGAVAGRVETLVPAGVVSAPHALRMPATANRASPRQKDWGRIVILTPCRFRWAARPLVIERRNGIANGSAFVGQLLAKHQAVLCPVVTSWPAVGRLGHGRRRPVARS